jgi:ABC-type branched-subunit amino acid transport system ATPase component
MTAAENVAMGLECRLAGRGPFGQLRAPRRERSQAVDSAREAMNRCGIADLADIPAGELSTGQRRLVELARAITGDFRFLLLDEPSSGLDERETEHFAELLHGVSRTHGIGILLVEHDMALVREVCSYIYCLDFGQLIYEGETAEALDSDVVRAAYLGAEEAEEGVVGAVGR